jgi:uncharacterized short protein YbdD (DUF466 family)
MGRLIVDLVWCLARRGWQAGRVVSGDDAYDRYLETLQQGSHGAAPMSRSRFFEERLTTKWNRLSSCGRCFGP